MTCQPMLLERVMVSWSYHFFLLSDLQMLLLHSLQLEVFAIDQIFIGFSFLESWAMLFPLPKYLSCLISNILTYIFFKINLKGTSSTKPGW